MSKAQFVAQFDELPLQAFVHIWFYYGQKKKLVSFAVIIIVLHKKQWK